MDPAPASPPGAISDSYSKDLERSFRILAIDLIGFGESSRKPAKPFFDLDLWLRQARFALNLLGDGPVGIIGHSVSAVLALKIGHI